MGVFGLSHLEKVELNLIEKLVNIVDRLTLMEWERRHELVTFVSSITLNNQKTTGKIMATSFKKTEKVSYSIAFTKKDGSPGDIQPGTFTISADNGNVQVVPSADNPLVGEILGVEDGVSVISWSAKSLGGTDVPGSITITVADEPPPPDTEVVATAITLGDAVPQ